MRIIYLFQYFNTPEMSGGTRAYEMGRRLVQAGHEVHVVTSYFRPDPPSDNWFTTNEDGIIVHWLPVLYSNTMKYGERIRAFLRFAWGATRKAASLGGDVVFATSTPLTIAIPGVFATLRNRIPMVFEVRDLWPEVPIAMGVLKNPLSRSLARLLERFAYMYSSRIVALSPGMAEGVVKAGYDLKRITVIPNGCDLELFRSNLDGAARFRSLYPELGNGPIVLYAGKIGMVNGVEYMAHVASVVKGVVPDARFVVLGFGAEEKRVRATAKSLGVLNENFFMYPRLPKKEVVDVFSAASVVASWVIDVPELEANSANKFFDGLAAGKPVAINYGGWQADLLRETGAGVVLSRNYQEAAGQLAELLNDPVRLEAAGKAARKLAEERFARGDLAAKLEEVLLKAVQEGRRK